MKKIFTFLLISVFFIGCWDNSIKYVKDGILSFDKSITVGQAFDNYKYFKSVKWISFTTHNGRKIIEVDAELDETNNKFFRLKGWKNFKKAILIFQFVLNKDKTFYIYNMSVKFIMKDGTEKFVDGEKEGWNRYLLQIILREIYQNIPFT